MENNIEWGKVKSNNEKLIKEFIENLNNFSLLSSNVRSELELMLAITGCKTKEDLIRYIVCDGEPADESCINHYVTVSNYINFSWNNDLILRHFDANGYPFVVNARGELEGFQFAKKKPGYDYTRKAE